MLILWRVLICLCLEGHADQSNQNPLAFLLRAAQINPDKLALVHPDVPYPAFYTYAVWCVLQTF